MTRDNAREIAVHLIFSLGFGTQSADEVLESELNRERFDELLERFSIKRPQGRGVLGMDEALNAAHELGYPVLLRPSYVIGCLLYTSPSPRD